MSKRRQHRQIMIKTLLESMVASDPTPLELVMLYCYLRHDESSRVTLGPAFMEDMAVLLSAHASPIVLLAAIVDHHQGQRHFDEAIEELTEEHVFALHRRKNSFVLPLEMVERAVEMTKKDSRARAKIKYFFPALSLALGAAQS